MEPFLHRREQNDEDEDRGDGETVQSGAEQTVRPFERGRGGHRAEDQADESLSEGRQNSLGLRFSGQGAGARLTLQLVTATNQACGTKITLWVVDKTKPKGPERKYRPPQVKNDGTRYTWKLDYDPQANDGHGQMQFTMKSNSAMPAEFEGQLFVVPVPKGYKDQGTKLFA